MSVDAKIEMVLPKDIEKLLQGITSNPQQKYSIKISNGENMQEALESISNTSNIVEIKARGIIIGLDVGLKSRHMEYFKKFKHLELIDFAHVKLRDKSVPILSTLIGENPHLRIIYLEGNSFSPKGFAELTQSFPKANQLKELHLDYLEFNPKDLASALREIPNLTHLGINSCSFVGTEEENVLDLIESLKSCPKLEYLGIGHNDLFKSENIAREFVHCLTYLVNMKVLFLSKNLILPRHCETLVKAFKKMTFLERLQLSGNKIGNVGMQAIVQGLVLHNKCIKKIEMNGGGRSNGAPINSSNITEFNPKSWIWNKILESNTEIEIAYMDLEDPPIKTSGTLDVFKQLKNYFAANPPGKFQQLVTVNSIGPDSSFKSSSFGTPSSPASDFWFTTEIATVLFNHFDIHSIENFPFHWQFLSSVCTIYLLDLKLYAEHRTEFNRLLDILELLVESNTVLVAFYRDSHQKINSLEIEEIKISYPCLNIDSDLLILSEDEGVGIKELQAFVETRIPQIVNHFFHSSVQTAQQITEELFQEGNVIMEYHEFVKRICYKEYEGLDQIKKDRAQKLEEVKTQDLSTKFWKGEYEEMLKRANKRTSKIVHCCMDHLKQMTQIMVFGTAESKEDELMDVNENEEDEDDVAFFNSDLHKNQEAIIRKNFGFDVSSFMQENNDAANTEESDTFQELPRMVVLHPLKWFLQITQGLKSRIGDSTSIPKSSLSTMLKKEIDKTQWKDTLAPMLHDLFEFMESLHLCNVVGDIVYFSSNFAPFVPDNNLLQSRTVESTQIFQSSLQSFWPFDAPPGSIIGRRYEGVPRSFMNKIIQCMIKKYAESSKIKIRVYQQAIAFQENETRALLLHRDQETSTFDLIVCCKKMFVNLMDADQEYKVYQEAQMSEFADEDDEQQENNGYPNNDDDYSYDNINYDDDDKDDDEESTENEDGEDYESEEDYGNNFSDSDMDNEEEDEEDNDGMLANKIISDIFQICQGYPIVPKIWCIHCARSSLVPCCNGFPIVYPNEDDEDGTLQLDPLFFKIGQCCVTFPERDPLDEEDLIGCPYRFASEEELKEKVRVLKEKILELEHSMTIRDLLYHFSHLKDFCRIQVYVNRSIWDEPDNSKPGFYRESIKIAIQYCQKLIQKRLEVKDCDLQPWDFFLSHAGEQKKFIEEEVSKTFGIKDKVFFDTKILKPGDNQTKIMMDALISCKYGVVVLSKEFVTKKWPLLEYLFFGAREDMKRNEDHEFTLIAYSYEENYIDKFLKFPTTPFIGPKPTFSKNKTEFIQRLQSLSETENPRLNRVSLLEEQVEMLQKQNLDLQETLQIVLDSNKQLQNRIAKLEQILIQNGP